MYILMLAPSLSYVTMCYLPVYIINVVFLVITYVPPEAALLVAYIAREVTIAALGLPVWYLFQKRELTRFF